MSLPTINYGQQEEMPHLRSQNDQLWKIIEKQRIMIQNLQKDNVRLSAERDGLQDKVNILKRELVRKQKAASLLITPQAMCEIAEAADDNASITTPTTTTATPSSETAPSSIEQPYNLPSAVVTSAPSNGPMPPPRSPYRPLVKEKSDDALVFESSQGNNKKSTSSSSLPEQVDTSTTIATATVDIFSMAKNSLAEDFAAAVDNNINLINGRSSPGSPAPGPQSPAPQSPQSLRNQPSSQSPIPGQQQQQLRKDSAPLPSTKMPVVVPSPSKSSSLEARRNARQRDSMIPPARGISPTKKNAANNNTYHYNNTLKAEPFFTTAGTATTTTNTNINNTFTTTTTNLDNNNMPATNTNRRQLESVHPTATIQPSPRTEKKHNNDDPQQSLSRQQQQQQPRSVIRKQQQLAVLNNLSSILVKVVGSNIKANEKGKEVISFIISIGLSSSSHKESEQQVGGSSKSQSFDEKWRVEKLYSDFLALDSKLKAQRNRAVSGKVGRLPDKALFSNNAPTKVDQRKIALEQYLQHVLALPLEDPTDLRNFLSTDIVNTRMYQITGQKEGYLTKRGKNFGGWKTRYFVLNESVLEYYESKEGTQLGSIRLTNAQIGTQMQASTSSDDSNSVYRHAFLIVEQKRSGSSHSVRHILCASSDDDRDSWVHALLQNISISEDDTMYQTRSSTSSSSSTNYSKKKTSSEKPRKLSKGEIRAISATPISHLKLDHVAGNAADMEKLISVPTINTHIDDNSNNPNKQYQHYHHQQQQQHNRPMLGHSNSSDPALNTSSNGLMTSPLATKNNMTWSSSYETRSSFDQSHMDHNGSNSSKGSRTTRPSLTRRSSMGNLLSTREYEQPEHRRAVSPTIISRLDDRTKLPYPSPQSLTEQQLFQLPEPQATTTTSNATSEKKARNKAHRMTLWGKKMLFNSSNDASTSHDSQYALQQSSNNNINYLPQPSQSSSAIINSSSSSSASSGLTPGIRGFLSRSSHEQQQSDRHARSNNSSNNNESNAKYSKHVFGVPLEEAVRISRVTEGYELPAVVYRCIEYLDAMNAVHEEGIYRLSGSNATLKALRERFNQEGDVPLLKYKQEYDIHVVAGLLKMWLRELPTSVLTREHRMDFLHVIDLLDREDRVNELGRLVSLLPLANYTLLRALTAHLIRVVQHSDINKMTMRNVSIVFSPTLGIPPTIFNLFMSEFDYIFWTTKDGDAAPRKMMKEENVVSVGENKDSAAAAIPAVTTEGMDEKTQQEEEGESVEENKHQRVPVQAEIANQTASKNEPTAHGAIVDQDSNNQTVPMTSAEGATNLSRKTTLRLREEHGRSNRNSVNYMDGAPMAIVDLEKHKDGPPILDEGEDEELDDLNLSSSESSYPIQS